jgi:dihydrofolate reductase
MRAIVCQMMMSLNGRVDDPYAFVTGVADDQYEDIDHAFAAYDTVIVGHATYAEMVAYWPGALADPVAAGAHARMAERMDRYRKVVLTRDPGFRPDWNNAEAALVRDDADLVALVADLRAAPGKTILLAGGAMTARAFARLGLVDAYRLYVYPVLSPGKLLFADIDARSTFGSAASRHFSNGVTLLEMNDARTTEAPPAPASFDALIE